jgi:hypothetical protein
VPWRIGIPCGFRDNLISTPESKASRGWPTARCNILVGAELPSRRSGNPDPSGLAPIASSFPPLRKLSPHLAIFLVSCERK